jgi:hypothetical protein
LAGQTLHRAKGSLDSRHWRMHAIFSTAQMPGQRLRAAELFIWGKYFVLQFDQQNKRIEH